MLINFIFTFIVVGGNATPIGMKDNKIMDDLVGVAGSLAGLANDARNSLHDKGSKLKTALHAMDEIKSLSDRLGAIEARLNVLEEKQETSL